MSDMQSIVQALELLDRRRNIYKLEYYQPYPFQLKFHNAEGYKTPQIPAKQRLLMAANKTGKTTSAAMEIAFHATGKYPEWWNGTVFYHPTELLACGLTNESVKEIGQRELFGDPSNEKMLGTGTIPIDCVGKIKNKPGLQNAFDTVLVKHVSGHWSRLYFRAYEQGWKKFQGVSYDVLWPDEEPPMEIWSQLLRACIARRQSIILCTMTPEEGMTGLVTQFMNNLQPGQALLGATWDDAPHITKEVRDQLLQAFPSHERDMRTKGVPLQGSGLIFQIADEDILVNPFKIPDYWQQIIGIDFGISTEHPFSAAKLAIDPDTGITYLISEYQTTNQAAAMHVDGIREWGDWIPVSWPHDGLNREKGTGDELQQIYRKKGLPNMLPWKATNPPDYSVGQKEGEGGNSLEKSVLTMFDEMLSGKFKVFNNCTRFMQEKRMYHRDKHNKIVRLNEDLICAARYAHMMKRHADSMFRRNAVARAAAKLSRGISQGASNWG